MAGTSTFPFGMSTLPATSGTSSNPQITALLLELQGERERRTELELQVAMLKKKVERAEYQQHLESEIESIASSRKMIRNGPDTVQHFEAFSMSGVIAELQTECPELYSLVRQLGNTQRNVKGSTSDEELKGVMAICTLLNARSARVRGMQLLISLMLVARGTGKQVYTCAYTLNIHI